MRPPSRRPSEVYVDVPSSSFHKPFPLHATTASKENAVPGMARSPSLLAQTEPNTPAVSSTTKRKRTLSETQPARDSGDATTSSRTSKKTKARDAEQDKEVNRDSTAPKRRKTHEGTLGTAQPSTGARKSKPKDARSVSTVAKGKDLDASNANEEFPNGFFYCHQCAKKRDATAESTKEERCKAKYCKACLKNRYGKDVDAIHEEGEPEATRKKNKSEHVSGCGYVFRCPKCEDICNCCRCRKAKGLDPVGNLTLAARKAGAGSVAAMLSDDPTASGILPGKGAQVARGEKLQKAQKAKDKDAKPKGDTAEAASKKRGRPRKDVEAVPSSNRPTGGDKKRQRAKPKKTAPIPNPTWTRIPTPLNLDEAEARMHIREFMLRFAEVMGSGKRDTISKALLEELEVIDTDGHIREDDDNPQLPESVGWVSEACIKAMLIGLLSLIAEDHNIKDKAAEAIKEIRASSANLNKMWVAVSGLRSSTFVLPDPLPPPAYAAVRTTRSVNVNEGVLVANTAQFVPVIAALIDRAMGTEAVREEINEGIKELVEKAREARETRKKEETRWEVVPKGNGQGNHIRNLKAQHLHMLEDIEQSLNVVTNSVSMIRFAPLGRDIDGRIYYALHPGVVERDAALETIKSDTSSDRGRAGKGGGRRTAHKKITAEEREETSLWSWQVAVWGPLPEGALKQDGSTTVTSVNLDDGKTRWWAFCHPDEIRKLAQWVAAQGGVATDGLDADAEEGSGANGHARNGVASSSATGKSSSLSSSLSSSPDSEDDDMMSELSDLSAPADIKMDIESSRPSKGEVQGLVQGLQEYADALQWRIRRWGEEVEPEPSKGVTKKKATEGPIEPSKFYS
ncbi:hypothetical protein PUNSTDRAFT_42853 [Punctularia strigosozonata HHB-11173 SS5]|uniref:uncharacterized protein n=1 Tax=Punctularia strigosozonata (strain HHB-11173) TaxID=741275 RepID=UPI0004416A0E|nr:uncharacterized protein PUNSTDRAFT_42853 [Punctularia strigosozonata HHB-11173 SS5]EIN11663.1 hypothetical protein PUNSTDRAFT_42853 [Punctularia strigosozonata HHB-11173 SS5]